MASNSALKDKLFFSYFSFKWGMPNQNETIDSLKENRKVLFVLLKLQTSTPLI